MAATKILSDTQRAYAIESNIPIAPLKAENSIYPFLKMNVGDSFALKDDSLREGTNVRNAIAIFNKAHAPMKFSLRLNRASGKYRCWRIA